VVPNAARLGSRGVSALVVSGPNMGGKTVYIKQCALLCLMAHLGCFVPARSFRCSVLDGIYVRMGAQDALPAGLSTFQVELGEASQILAAATCRSLVILDELGRGTSTADGLAIAMATLKHLLAWPQGGQQAEQGLPCPLVFFVTHYHEVLAEVGRANGEKVRCVFMDHLVDPAEGSRVTYLYKAREGTCGSSFGFSVALKAGLPLKIVERAKQLSSTQGEGEATRPE